MNLLNGSMSDFFLGTGRLPPSLRVDTSSSAASADYSHSSRLSSYERESHSAEVLDRSSRDDRDVDWRSERFRTGSQGPCWSQRGWKELDAYFEDTALNILSAQGGTAPAAPEGADRHVADQEADRHVATGMIQTSGSPKGCGTRPHFSLPFPPSGPIATLSHRPARS